MDFTTLKMKLTAARQAGRFRYTEEMKRQILACVAEEVERGTSKTRAIKTLGVGWDSYHRWAEALGASSAFASVRVQAAVVERAERREIVLVSPTGWRVEGLRMEDVARLLGGAP